MENGPVLNAKQIKAQRQRKAAKAKAEVGHVRKVWKRTERYTMK
jgi:hypothetical protein